VTPETLGELSGWDIVVRGRFETSHGGHRWVIDLNYFDFGERIALYRDNELVAEEKSPATFDLGDGAAIEARMGVFGMRSAHLLADGNRTMLTPVHGTAEAWRLGLEQDRPALSRAVGIVSWAVLVLALVIDGFEIAGFVNDDLDVLGLPGSVATLVGLLALAAVIERALRLKCSRWLD